MICDKRSLGIVVGLTVVLSVASARAAFTVAEDVNGGLSVLRDGKPLVSRIAVDVGGGTWKGKSSFVRAADGSRVWNRWCEDRDRKFRFEAVERKDGAIELSLVGEVEPPVRERLRALRLEIAPGALDGKAFDALEGNGRDYRAAKGAFDDAFGPRKARWLATDGVVFDFNPTGAGEYNSGFTSRTLVGVWDLERVGGRLRFSGVGDMKTNYGGYVGLKLVIREGTQADYPRVHFLRKFHYRYHLDAKIADVRRVCFGAPKHGDGYAEGDHPFAADGTCGWTADVPRRTAVGSGSGAYYSCVCGKGPATYRFAGLPSGYYIATAHVGNWTGEVNRFSVAANGNALGTCIDVPKGKARTLSRAVHVADGNLDFAFDGAWLVSALSVQPVLSDAEDFSVGRAFWYVAGYEPSVFFRTEDYAAPVVFGVADETVDMPPPGGECAGPCGRIGMPVELPDPDLPSLAWLKNVKTYYFLNNYSSFAETADPKVLKDYLDGELAGCDYNNVRLSGMHSRHTYINHLDRGVRAVGRICDEFHRRGMKVIDHHDATLLWNFPAGFRVMMERLPETVRGTSDYMPSMQLCPNNRTFKDTYMKYLRRLVEKGVDGFNLDEVEFWAHGCQCAACRADFHRDTGWWMPLDETHPALRDCYHPLAAALYDWRTKKITNWFVDLRRYLKDIRPDLVLSTYTTHYGLIRQLPREYATYSLLDFTRAMNLFGTEVMTRNNLQSARSLVPYRKMYNVFLMQNGIPVYGGYYCQSWQDAFFSYCAANTCGQVALVSDLPRAPGMPPFDRWMTSALNMNREGAANVAEVALLFSVTSRDWNRYCGFADELFGTAQELEAMHVPYDIIHDPLLTPERLGKYKVLVLGASNCLSDEAAAEIRAFAERGGTVVLSSLTGLFDEMGQRRKKALFGDLTGYDPPGSPKVQKRAPGEEPAFRETPVGRGRFVYFPKLVAGMYWAREITPGQSWKFDPDPRDQRILRAAFSKLIGAAAWWTVSAPDRVITSVWREKDGTLAVHVLNELGPDLKPGEVMTNDPPATPFPALDADIVFTLPATDVKRVTVASPELDGETELSFAANGDGTVTVTLRKDLVKAYALVRIRRKARE